jgi:hypothetical protein
MSQWPDQATRAFESWEREKKSKRYRYWSMLRSAKDEFIKITQQEMRREMLLCQRGKKLSPQNVLAI